MLAGMNIPVAAAPWIVLGAVLGIMLLVTAGLTTLWLYRRSGRRPDRPEAAGPHDDLPDFLERPPGSDGNAGPATGDWVPLAAAPPVGAAEPSRRGRPPVAPLTAAVLALVLLVGVAAAAAVASRSEDRSPGDGSEASPQRGMALELGFGGVVLEPRAVGVTATYPRVVVTARDGQAVADVELPTYNCLTAEAPDDPVAAGCTPAGTEHARLTTPELTVESGADGVVRVTGRFPTSWRPNGSTPVPTGRTYALEVTAKPAVAVRPGEWVPATGTLRLGDDSASTAHGAADRLRIGR
jgi:hypothetical protein